MILSSKPPGLSTEGWHRARCISIVDLGQVLIAGKHTGKVLLSFELPFDRRPFTQGTLTPKLISREYSSSLWGESRLKKELIKWIGEQATASLDQFKDWFLLLDQPCQIRNAHSRDWKNQWFDTIEEISSAPENALPPAHNPLTLLTYDKFDIDTFLALPQWLQKKMRTSIEFEALQLDAQIKAHKVKTVFD